MDYLDPKKQLQHRIILLVGYVFVAVAIVIATIILLYRAYGFGIGQHGSVIQNGLVFVSSQPVSAEIAIDGVKKSQTSSRILLPAGIYQMNLSRLGYRDWKHTLDIQGGSVSHFDYALLIPDNLKPVSIHSYATAPTLTTQSPDKRWLVVQTNNATLFDVFDLKNPDKLPVSISLLPSVVTKAVSAESWQTVQWADDNQHLLLQHDFDGKTEYILVDRQNVDQSINLNINLSISTGKLSLRDDKFNQFYVYDAVATTLKSASLNSSLQTPLLDRVLAFKPLGADSVLYITDALAVSGNVALNLQIGNQSYSLRALPSSDKYLLDLTNYGGSLYIAASNVISDKVYVYKDPLNQLKAQPNKVVAPIQTLRLDKPNYISFSSDPSEYLIVENSNYFRAFDLKYKTSYRYTLDFNIDQPQTHANWMDSSHLTYVSGGKMMVFDFDGANQQTLGSASSVYPPAFSADNKVAYYFNNNAFGGIDLIQMSLIAD